jgi:DNA invertase Pin-like site-specific DNA recombinase
MKVAIYARVSTDDKDQNPETQLRVCRDYCEKAGYEIYDTFVDKARAKDYKRRKQWQRLLKEAHQRRFNGVICLRLDRPFRTVRECANVLGDWLNMNIAFKAVQQEVVDTTTSSGRFITWILAAAAELESAWIGERVAAGMARAKAEGKSVGRKSLGIKIGSIIEALQNETSIAAAARVLGCSRRYIYRICGEHGLDPLALNGK